MTARFRCWIAQLAYRRCGFGYAYRSGSDFRRLGGVLSDFLMETLISRCRRHGMEMRLTARRPGDDIGCE